MASLLSRNIPVERGRWRFEALAATLAKESTPFGSFRTIHTRHGFKLRIDPRDAIGSTIFARGEWEPGCTRVVKALLPLDGLFVDVGGHLGYYALLASRAVGQRGRVLCFEPIPSNRMSLAHNLAINRVRNCVVRSEALWSRHEMLTLNLLQGNTGMATVRDPGSSEIVSGREVVTAVPLDALHAELEGLSLIKIDVEGAEYDVIQGMDRVLKTHKPNLVVEIAEAFQRQVGHSAAQLVDLLIGYGYRMFAIEWNGCIRPADARYADSNHQFEALFTTNALPQSLRKYVVDA